MNRLVAVARRRKAAGGRGFTLIELLIVIVVLGIMAAVVVFGVARFKNDATEAACKTTVGTVQSAAAAYKTKYGAYPTGMGSLTAAAPNNYLVTAPSNPSFTWDAASLPVQTECSLDGAGGGGGGGGGYGGGAGGSVGPGASYSPAANGGALATNGGAGSVAITWS